MPLPFLDRADAGRQLAGALARYRGMQPLVLAIPRGGVPVGRVVADALGGEFGVVLVRKLGAPSNPELAIGAVDEQGTILLNENANEVGADPGYINREAARQLLLMRERRRRYGEGQGTPAVAGRTVIVVDDGLATGATMAAALRALRMQRPARLVCALPVASAEGLADVRRQADEVVCLATPTPFHAVGVHYRDFSSVDDAAVCAALDALPKGMPAVARSPRIEVDGIVLDADLIIPASPCGVVVFAHGSGSSRLSARNRAVAHVLQQRGIATLLLDLLAPEEDREASARFDIDRLVRRLEAALAYLSRDPVLHHLPCGLFGASTGAAAALAVAAGRPGLVAAVVARGGRPDLVAPAQLARVRTPTLLIVGGADRQVLELNRRAKASIGAWAELRVVPGATHLFEEPGALEQVARLAADWLARKFRGLAPAAVA